MKAKLFVAAALLTAAACKTPGTESAIKANEGQNSGAATEAEIADLLAKAEKAKFASGEFSGINWEMRFNFPQCNHTAENKWFKLGVFCTGRDAKAAAEFGGVDKELDEWAKDPATKTLYVSYFSFSAKSVAQTLCDAANAGKKVHVFMHRENVTSGAGSVGQLTTCNPQNLKVYSRGSKLGFLQHAKIFLASPAEDPVPLHMMPKDQQAAAGELTTRWTSSSANMSAFGTSLHFDNWLFFQAKTSERLAQENLCFFNSMKTMKNFDPTDGGTPLTSADTAKINSQSNAEKKLAMKTNIVRWDFAQRYDACIQKIAAPVRPEIQFFPVPNEYQVNGQKRNGPQIWPVIRNELNSVSSEVKIISDRLTTGNVYNPLVQAKAAGKDVQVILDDDTFRVSKCRGGAQLDQIGFDAQSMHALIDGGVSVTFLDTNGGNPPPPTLQHNKLMIIDRDTLIQGAGNFTNSAINIAGPGNFEHFYVIKVQPIVDAYLRAWDYLLPLTTRPEEHEVSGHPFRIPNGLNFDDSPCSQADGPEPVAPQPAAPAAEPAAAQPEAAPINPATVPAAATPNAADGSTLPPKADAGG